MVVTMTDSSYGSSVAVAAHPREITVGGTVVLTAEPPDAGTYDAEWQVVGPAYTTRDATRIAQLGTTTIAGGRIEVAAGELIRATLDTTPLAVGSWRVRIRLTVVATEGEEAEAVTDDEPTVYEGESGPIDVFPRPLQAGDDLAVTLKRTAVPATSDQALWVAVRKSTNAISFERYTSFLDVVLCGEPPDPAIRFRAADTSQALRKVKRRTTLPFTNVERYRLLKAATEVFLMVHSCVDLDDFTGIDLLEESRRLNRTVQPGDLETLMREYLVRVATGQGDFVEVLPYLGLIRLQLRDVVIVGADDEDDEAAQVCHGIIAERLTNPCLLELLWSYWHDEGGLLQTLGAITWRFQNRASGPPGRDPLAGLAIDPLRPLSNLLWGWIQDTQHRLSVGRRAYEYDHEYGLVLSSKPGPPVRGADSRSRFIESFHHLLAVSAEFFMRDDDTTVIADGFAVLNALKETHIVLTQGSHNQYGDLPSTARQEMLMAQYILAQPEVREFLPTRTMVVEPEAWISRVEAMNRLMGGSDVAVLHFRDLAVFGEQLLLGIRFGSWTTVNEPERAANWARYWRSEIQRYTHAYRAVTGVDLTRRPDPAVPAYHLRRRQYAPRG